MGTIAEKLNYLNTTKTNIKNAIIKKGVTVETTDTFRDYATRISEITDGSVEELTVTENGTYTGTEGVTYNPVNVNLPLGSKSITANGTYTASDDSLQGYSEVTVDIDDTDLYRDTTDSTYESVKTLSNCGAFPMLSLKVGIEPQQDLHGYDHPWVGGAGKNKIPPLGNKSNNGITMTTDINGNTIFNGTVESGVTFEAYVDLPSALTGNYVLSINNSQTISAKYLNTFIALFDGSTRTHAELMDVQNKKIVVTNETITRFSIRFQAGLTVTNFKISVQIEEGSTATSYASYSNICPISGWDEVNVTRCGTNVWDEEWEIDGVQFKAKNLIPVKPNTSYYFKSPLNAYSAFKYDVNGNSLGPMVMTKDAVFTTDSKTYYIWFSLSVNDYGTTYNNDIGINYPSTDTEYHAYNGQNYNITLSDTQGVVYYGALNLITGEGQITHKKKVLDGTQSIRTVNWLPTSNGVGWIYPYSVLGDSKIVTSGTPNMLCDTLEVVNYFSIYQGGIGIALYYSTYASICLRQTDTSLTTEELINAYLAENPIEVVYELATPITFNVTPIDLTLADGTNNIWADTGDVGDVRYFKKVEL